MNNYSAYDPEFCNGHYCCRDCEKCPIADKIISALSKKEEEEDGD